MARIKALSYAWMILLGLIASVLMVAGGIFLFNSIAAAPYANLAAVTVSLILASVGAVLFFACMYSVIKDIIRIEEAEHEKHEHAEHEEHHKKE